MDALISRIAAPPEARPATERSEQAGPNWQNRKGDRRVQGALVQLDCSRAGPRFHVVVEKRETVLRVEDPSKVVLLDAPGQSVQLRCGPFPSRPVTVEYPAKPDAQGGTAGEIAALEFH